MPKETGVVVCPNSKCHRKIEEPILLNNLSTTPAEQYPACPHCFIKLTEDAENDESTIEESTPTQLTEEAENDESTIEESTPTPPVHSSLERVLDAISAQPQREKEEKTKEEATAKTPEAEGEERSGCSYNFGYLANRPRDAPIPQECLTCQRIVDCMLKLGATRKDESE